MITQSGCFGGGGPSYEQLDTAAQAAAVVDQLQMIEKPTDDGLDTTATAIVQLSVAYDAMARRVRLLSWAVVLFAIYIIAKEF